MERANIESKKIHYKDYAEQRAKKSNILADCLRAFFVGGFICTLGQLFHDFYLKIGFEEANAGTLSSVTLIFLTAIFTGIGVFDRIAKFGGAGTLVPITGFANSVVSPALEFKDEGRITGTAAQMFSIAGPVIVFGCSAAAVYGVICFIFKL